MSGSSTKLALGSNEIAKSLLLSASLAGELTDSEHAAWPRVARHVVQSFSAFVPDRLRKDRVELERLQALPIGTELRQYLPTHHLVLHDPVGPKGVPFAVLPPLSLHIVGVLIEAKSPRYIMFPARRIRYLSDCRVP